MLAVYHGRKSKISETSPWTSKDICLCLTFLKRLFSWGLRPQLVGCFPGNSLQIPKTQSAIFPVSFRSLGSAKVSFRVKFHCFQSHQANTAPFYGMGPCCTNNTSNGSSVLALPSTSPANALLRYLHWWVPTLPPGTFGWIFFTILGAKPHHPKLPRFPAGIMVGATLCP